MDFIDYREKLGIGFDNRDLEDLFFNRLFNVLDDLNAMEMQISSKEYFNFCKEVGWRIKHDALPGEYWEIILTVLHKTSSSIKEFLPYYMFFINIQVDNKYKRWKKSGFKKLLCDCLNMSHISYEILEDKGDYFVFPKGVEEFDRELISNNLMWLKDYPATHKAWISALKDYNESTDITASETADNFRKTLERFFQEFFNSEKSLENLKSEYGEFLKEKGIPSELSNNFEKLLELYTKYMNNYAKHHDKVSKNVLEYIMYQTGNLIRLLITLKQD